MRRTVLVAVLALGLAACGGTAAPKSSQPLRIEFGITGGNIRPTRIVVSPDGSVSETGGTLKLTNTQLSRSTESSLSRLVRSALAGGLASRQCRGTLPDIGARYVRADGRTITVRGPCEAAFERLWAALTHAVGVD